MTSTFYVALLFWIVAHYKVLCQCSGNHTSVSVGYSTEIIKLPQDVHSIENSTLSCGWKASSNTSVSLLFMVTDVMLKCEDGAIDIYEGTSNASQPLFKNICKNNGASALDHVTTATSGNVFISYSSNNSNTVSPMDFKIYLISTQFVSDTGTQCSVSQNLTATDNIKFLSFFTNNTQSPHCSWNISADDDTANIKIAMEFLEIGQPMQNSTSDYLEIKENEQTFVQLFKDNISDPWHPNSSYSSQGNTLTILLHFEDSKMNRGFVLSYTKSVSDNMYTLDNAAEINSTLSTPHEDTSKPTEPVHESTAMKEVTTGSTTTPNPTTTTTKATTKTKAPTTTPQPAVISSPSSQTSNSDDDKTGAIVGVVIGGLVAVVLITVLILMYRKKRTAFAIFNTTRYSKHTDDVTMENGIANENEEDDKPPVTNNDGKTLQDDECGDEKKVPNADETIAKPDEGQPPKTADDKSKPSIAPGSGEEPSKATEESKSIPNISPGSAEEPAKVTGESKSKPNVSPGSGDEPAKAKDDGNSETTENTATATSDVKEDDLIKLEDVKVKEESTSSSSPEMSPEKSLITLDVNDTNSNGLLAAIDGEISKKDDNLITLDDRNTKKVEESGGTFKDNASAEVNEKTSNEEDTNKDETTKSSSENSDDAASTDTENSESDKEDAS